MSFREIAPIDRKSGVSHYGGKGEIIYVYAAKCDIYVKIGLTTLLRNRIATMRSGCPIPIEVLVSIPLNKPDAIAAEMAIGLRLSGKHHIGEWFQCSSNDAIAVVTECCSAYSISIPEPDDDKNKPTSRSTGMSIISPLGEFGSITEAAAAHGVSKQAISSRVLSGSSKWKRTARRSEPGTSLADLVLLAQAIRRIAANAFALATYGDRYPRKDFLYARMKETGMGDLIIEISTLYQPVRDLDAVGHLISVVNEPIGLELGADLWDESIEGRPHPTETVFYIKTLDQREFRWTNASFIAAPVWLQSNSRNSY